MAFVGSRIKAARDAAGITQEQLGKLIGVTGVTIMRYEKGQREPRLEQLQSIANALNISVSQLLGFRPEDLGGDSNNQDWMKFNQAILEAGITIEFDKIVNSFLENDAEKLFQAYEQLNAEGKKKARERVSELTEIQRYQQREKPAPDTSNASGAEPDDPS